MQVRKRRLVILSEDYFNLEDHEDQLHDFESFSKGEVLSQEDESQDMEVLETSDGDEPIGEPVVEIALTKKFLLLRFFWLELLLLLRFLQPELPLLLKFL